VMFAKTSELRNGTKITLHHIHDVLIEIRDLMKDEALERKRHVLAARPIKRMPQKSN
jgi:hypothetical protein